MELSRAIEQVLSKVRIVPVIKLDDEHQAVPLADALLAGGLPIAEITYRTSAAPGAIRALKEQRPDIMVGAGTILTTEQVDSAIEAGAAFLVSPGFNSRVVQYAQKRGIPIYPGVNNPTQVEMALEVGLKVVKFFPAEASGGIAMLKALSAVYEVQYMPTGGISQKNVMDYLALEKVLCCGGSWMVSTQLIQAEKFDEIQRLTAEAVAMAAAGSGA